MQKARRHPDESGLRPLVSVWFQDLFHSSVRSTFHLSLTVLVHYRSLRSIQPYRMVPVDSHRISRVPCYSGYCQKIFIFTYTGLSPSMVVVFQSNFYFKINFHDAVLQPHICRNNYGLGCSHFNRLYFGNNYCYLFLRLLRCFSSPGLLLETSSR